MSSADTTSPSRYSEPAHTLSAEAQTQTSLSITVTGPSPRGRHTIVVCDGDSRRRESHRKALSERGNEVVVCDSMAPYPTCIRLAWGLFMPWAAGKHRLPFPRPAEKEGCTGFLGNLLRWAGTRARYPNRRHGDACRGG
jgi:hypothetical protein